jgi:hypothetical protein
MKRLWILTVVIAAVFAASSTVARGEPVLNAARAPRFGAAQDDHQKMGKMNMKKSAGKSARKKRANVKKKGAMKKGMNMKKKPARKNSRMGNMKMNGMDMR